MAVGYGPCAVLSDVHLSVGPGRVLAILGPNGSGKSTLLKTLAGLIPAVAGEARLGGEDVRRLSAAEVARRVAFVPQEEAHAFPFTVREIVTMGRLSRSTGLFDTPEDRERAEAAMTAADCANLADRPVTQLSGGERQRVLIARALAQDAPALLLDEPNSHQDVGHQIGVLARLGDLAKAGRAVVAAVHDLNAASILADEAMLVARGRVVLAGAMESVLESPELDATYGVRFERHRAQDGTLRLAPLIARG